MHPARVGGALLRLRRGATAPTGPSIGRTVAGRQAHVSCTSRARSTCYNGRSVPNVVNPGSGRARIDPEPVRMTDPTLARATRSCTHRAEPGPSCLSVPRRGHGRHPPEMLTFLETVRTGGGVFLQPSTTALMMANQRLA